MLILCHTDMLLAVLLADCPVFRRMIIAKITVNAMNAFKVRIDAVEKRCNPQETGVDKGAHLTEHAYVKS